MTRSILGQICLNGAPNGYLRFGKFSSEARSRNRIYCDFDIRRRRRWTRINKFTLARGRGPKSGESARVLSGRRARPNAEYGTRARAQPEEPPRRRFPVGISVIPLPKIDGGGLTEPPSGLLCLLILLLPLPAALHPVLSLHLPCMKKDRSAAYTSVSSSSLSAYKRIPTPGVDIYHEIDPPIARAKRY